MARCFIPVLILATVALSSSNVLPITVHHINKESLGLEGQYNDNIFSNRYQTRNVLDEIYKWYENKPTMSKLQETFRDPDNNSDDIMSIFNKNDENDNGEGFRKEQWHNYPRQLDRLHQIRNKEQINDKRNFDPDSSKEQYIEEPDGLDINDLTNELHLDSNTGTNNVYEAAMAGDPLLILKIRLAYLNKNVAKANNHYANLLNLNLESNNVKVESNTPFRNNNPDMNFIKVKREDVFNTQGDLSDNPSIENKAVNKRIFSLWSRLQSLNHKGHELQHRRHLHAFYGLPDSDGGGTLTAETRATLLRPPGSPLRWG